tara:strand:- start:7360 stop:8142 length:783 start_codon:yes stop_codon:yes gene_type:complete
MNTITSLLEKISNARPLEFGAIFNESLELFKKTWLQGFLLQLIIFIIVLPIIIVVYMPIIGLALAQSESGHDNPDAFSDLFTGMSVFYIIVIIIAIFALAAVQLALNAGFFRIMKKLDYNEQVSSTDFFYFFKAKYFNKTFLLMLVTVLIAIPAALLCYIPLLYVMVPMSFFSIIFAFNPELSIGDIVNASFKLGHKKWLLAFGLLIVSSILSQIIGLLLCGIGLLFTAAFVYHPLYLIYKKAIGFDGENEIEDIKNLSE